MEKTLPALPPGPRNSPLMMLYVTADPTPYFAQWAREFGDPFTSKSSIGTFVMTGDPECVRTLFTADPDTLEVMNPEALAPLIGSSAVILKSGTPHRADRKLLAPPFHGARMRIYGEIFRDIAEQHAQSWPVDRPFPIQRTTQAIALDAIIRAVFGVASAQRVQRFREAMATWAGSFSPLIIFFPGLRRNFGGFGPWARFQRASARLDALLYEEIAARRADPAPKDDILSLLLQARYDDGEGLSDVQIRDQLLTLLFAGHETTAITLAWAFYWLHRHQDARERLVAEVAALGERPDPEAIAKLPYLEAVCHESLRLHPSLPVLPGRRVKQPMTLGRYTLPAGVGVTACPVLVHLREDVYPEPHAFRPERFLGRTYSPFEYIPFGGGARRCLGSAFAMYEMKVVLATLLSRYRLRLRDERAVGVIRRSVTMGPARDIEMVRLAG